jgi:two-component system sensor histidine kinase UhpB
LNVRAISLRLRLIGLVAIGMAVSLIFGAAIACINASRSVQTEMRAALAVARQAVENAVRSPYGPDTLREIQSAIAAFDGNRHVHLSLAGAVAATPVLEDPAIAAVPAWFAGLIRAERTVIRIPVAVAGIGATAVIIESDPRNEILETWNAFCDTVVVLALFCGVTFALIHIVVGRALRPLDRLCGALQDIGRGDYTARIDGSLTPELARLYDSFNHMARRLADADARNRRLTREILTLQEEERRQIARDLHDEFGPCLFAVNVDAANAERLARTGRTGEIQGAVQGIADAVAHMQKHLRSMLGRLRPAGLAEFGLAEALRSLVEFWRQRDATIDYRLHVSDECYGFGDLLDTSIYRIVQEGLSNAVRHGHPASVAISVRIDADDRIVVEIADDGRGAADTGGGFGLLGMAERARGLGGTFMSKGRPDGGFIVRAVLPRVRQPAADEVGEQSMTGAAVA